MHISNKSGKNRDGGTKTPMEMNMGKFSEKLVELLELYQFLTEFAHIH